MLRNSRPGLDPGPLVYKGREAPGQARGGSSLVTAQGQLQSDDANEPMAAKSRVAAIW